MAVVRGGRFRRQAQRQQQKATLNSPWLPDPGTAPDPWPEIPSTHTDWWQVHRIDPDRDVLIAECRGRDAAYLVAGRQSTACRISKADDAISDEIFSPRRQ